MDCIFCNGGFESGQAVHMCPACRGIYHVECWDVVKSCFVCAKRTPAEAVLAAQQDTESQTVTLTKGDLRPGPAAAPPPTQPAAAPESGQPLPDPFPAAPPLVELPEATTQPVAEPAPYPGMAPGTARCLCGSMVPIEMQICAKCGRPHPAFRKPKADTPDDYARLSKSDALVYLLSSALPGFIGAALFAGFVWIIRLGRFIGSPLAEQMSVGSTNVPKLGAIEWTAFLFGFAVLTALLFYRQLKKNDK